MKKILKIFIVFLLLIVLGVLSAGFYVTEQLKPADPSKTERTAFAIPKGQSISGIGKRLQDAGLIRNANVFRFVVWQQRLGQKIQAGSFLISPSMSTTEVAHQLTLGTNDVWIKVLEGWRREEIADMLAEQSLPNFDKQEFLTLTKNDEGYLFPDSYLVRKDADAQSIRAVLHDTFEKKITRGLAAEIKNSSHDFHDVVTMASIVQREARDFDQMKIVASILWNRQQLNMALNADSTLQYMKGYDPIQHTWWPEPLQDDKAKVSPYNTYLNPGLPPAPIANSGLDAVRATLEAPKTEYLFYLHDRQGGLHYAKTLDEHNANVQKYLRS